MCIVSMVVVNGKEEKQTDATCKSFMQEYVHTKEKKDEKKRRKMFLINSTYQHYADQD
jgi:hypothetical protein